MHTTPTPTSPTGSMKEIACSPLAGYVAPTPLYQPSDTQNDLNAPGPSTRAHRIACTARKPTDTTASQHLAADAGVDADQLPFAEEVMTGT